MTKTELIKEVSNKANLSQQQARLAIDTAIDAVTDALTKGEQVSLIGFGALSVVERSERKGRNPMTKQEVIIPARKVIKFKAGSQLDAVIN